MFVNAQLHRDQKDNSKSIENVTPPSKRLKKSHLQDKSYQVWYFILSWDVFLLFQKDWKVPLRGLSLTLCFWAHDWWLMIMWQPCCWYLGKALWLLQLDLRSSLRSSLASLTSIGTALKRSLTFLPLTPACDFLVPPFPLELQRLRHTLHLSAYYMLERQNY